MWNRNPFPASFFGVAFLAVLLFGASPSHAQMQTFEKEYTYTASELDSKSSCRAIALEQVKRILLSELGVYVESVFSDKASSEGKTKDEIRREITTLSAGVASTEVVEEKWDGTTYWLKARIKADPDDVAKKIDAVRQDKQKVAELTESRKKAEELSRELERMRKETDRKAASDALELERMKKELDATKSAAAKAEQTRKYNETAQQVNTAKAEQSKKYNKTAQQLNASEWKQKGDALYEANQKAMELHSLSFGLPPIDSWDLRYWRGNAYLSLGDYQRAIKDYSKAIGIDLKFAKAYYNRGGIQSAQEDFKVAARLGDADAQELLKGTGIEW